MPRALEVWINVEILYSLFQILVTQLIYLYIFFYQNKESQENNQTKDSQHTLQSQFLSIKDRYYNLIYLSALFLCYYVLLYVYVCCIIGGGKRDFSLSGFILYLIVYVLGSVCSDMCGPKHSVFSHEGATGILGGTILSCSELHQSSQGGKHFGIPSRSADLRNLLPPTFGDQHALTFSN